MNKEIYTLAHLKNSDGWFVKYFEPQKAFLYYKNFRINLLTLEKEKYLIQDFHNCLRSFSFKKKYLNPIVFHLFYEFGYYLQDLHELINEEDILAIEIHYNKYEIVQLEHSEKLDISLLKKEAISFLNYKDKFQKGHEHLLKGNCYQFNLTSKSKFNFLKKYHESDFYYSLWENTSHIAPYAHMTYISTIDRMYLSNTPESLFELKFKKNQISLYSMPIKGSQEIIDGNIEQAWIKLMNSKKDQGELYMITDLISNDLSKIETPNARVLFKKLKLIVPKIVHQFSLVEVKLSYNITLFDIVSNLFPGGSITGCPKRRVLNILNELEDGPRGFYTGSTVILHRNMAKASINIRSADIDFKTGLLEYGAGGGITLLSEVNQEFNEMNCKVNSFISLL